jgi:nucleoid DNA-binding protein
MGKLYNKKELMKLLKGTEEYTKQDVIKKLNKLVEKLKKEIEGGDEEKIDGDDNVESEGKEEEETTGKKELEE